MKGISRLLAAGLTLCWVSSASAQSDTLVAHLGVLAHRGPEAATQHWLPLSQYLSSVVVGWRFEILPVTLVSAAEKIASKEIDFLITNPGHFVALAEEYSLSAIATRERLVDAASPRLLSYGTVILVRRDSGIRTISELRGKTLAAVSPDAFGGFQIAWKELVQQGVDPFSDLRTLRFMGFPQDAIVDAVATRQVDAGVVRSGLLESLEAEGRIASTDFEILNSLSQPGYPFRVTGHLFPEWPFVAVPGVSKDLRDSVAIALLRTQEPAVQEQFGLNDTWSAPLSYEGVRRLILDYQELGRSHVDSMPWLAFLAVSSSFGLGLLVAALWRQKSKSGQLGSAPSQLGSVANVLPAEDPCLALARERFESLTPREREALSLICSGQPSKTIASELGVSQKTIEFHRSNLLKKTDAGSTAHLVQLATRLGFDLGFSPAEIRQ